MRSNVSNIGLCPPPRATPLRAAPVAGLPCGGLQHPPAAGNVLTWKKRNSQAANMRHFKELL